jgi:hypothetical protein
MFRNSLIVLVVAALLAVGVFFGIRLLNHPSPKPAAEGVPLAISIGRVSSRAAQVAVGGRSYSVQTGANNSRFGRIMLTADAGSVAVVKDAGGHVLATAPVWAVPGRPPEAASATCASTAFDQFLLTPGVSGANPVTVDLLWSLAQQGQAGVDVAALGRLICAGLQHDSSHLAHPSQAEITASEKVYLDFQSELAKLVSQMPPLASSVAGIRTAMGTVTPSARTSSRNSAEAANSATSAPGAARAIDAADGLTRYQATLTAARTLTHDAVGGCAEGFSAVATAAGSTSPLALCSDSSDFEATNSSAAWAFLYNVPPGKNDGPGIPSQPASIVAGQASVFPSIETIVGAVIHDGVVGLYDTGCKALGAFHVHLDICKPASKPQESDVAKLFDLVEPGEISSVASAGYYSIAWGNGQGDQSAFPAGATSSAEQNVQRYSKNLTFISSVIVPTIGLILDRQLDDRNLPPQQLPLLVPVFNELAGSTLNLGANGEPSTISGKLHAVADTAKTLFGNPTLLGDIFKAFALPTFGQISEDVTKQLIEYLVGLEIPVAGWVALLVKLIAHGSAAATLVLSIAGMFEALTQPSYSSWTPTLTADAARQLPLFTPGEAASCPAPAVKAAIPPGAPEVPSCEWVVSVDLDGNGKEDLLVAWQTAHQRGAVAYLDDGAVKPLQNGSIPEEVATINWDQAGKAADISTNQPLRLIRAAQSVGQQVLLIDSIGAVGDEVYMVGLAADGSLRLATDPQGKARGILTARALGCATQAGNRLYVEGVLGRGEPGVSGGPYPGFGVSRSFYKVSDDLEIQFLGYEGEVLPKPLTSDPFGNNCAGNLPTVGSLPPYATTPQKALSGLLNAAIGKDENRGSAFVGGGFADFENPQFMPDVWKYLTTSKSIDPANWNNRPVNCNTSAFPVICSIAGANGKPLQAEMQPEDKAWVVSGLSTS